MTQEQIEIIIRLICLEAVIAANKLTSPQSWYEERDSLKEELRATARRKHDTRSIEAGA